MHTLYGFPMSCALAVHITLVQQALPFSITWLDRGPGRKIGNRDFDAINPKRKVPTLVLPSGEVLTEITGVLAHLGEVDGEPPQTRRRRIEWLSFLATELHQQVLGPTFDPATPQVAIDDAHERLLPPVLAHLEATLSQRPTLLDTEEPTSVDAYLIWALVLLRFRWPEAVSTPGLASFSKRMLGYDFVRGPLGVERLALRQGAHPEAPQAGPLERAPSKPQPPPPAADDEAKQR